MRKIGSFFLTIVVCFIIITCITISLDLVGIVNLPENLSLKKYLSKSIGVLASGEEIYYPDYNATGVGVENVDVQEIDNTINVTETKGRFIDNTVLDQEALNQVMSNLNSGDNKVQDANYDYNVTDNSFFYTQLDTYGKTFYSRLYSNLDNLKTGTYSVDFGVTFNDLLQNSNGESILTNAFQLSINALLLDHPEIFYFDYEDSVYWSNGKLEIKYINSKPIIRGMVNELENKGGLYA